MPKVLCLTALAISGVVFLLFLFDLLMRLVGMTSVAPFRGADLLIDVVFVVCAAVIGTMSFFTFREQV